MQQTTPTQRGAMATTLNRMALVYAQQGRQGAAQQARKRAAVLRYWPHAPAQAVAYANAHLGTRAANAVRRALLRATPRAHWAALTLPRVA